MTICSWLHVRPVLPWTHSRMRMLAWMSRHAGAEKLVNMFVIGLN